MNEHHDPVSRALENLGRVAISVDESAQASLRRDRVVGALGSVLGRVRARRTFVRRAWVTFFSVMTLGVVALGAVSLVKFREPDQRSTDQRASVVEPEVWKARAVVGTVLVHGAGRAERAARAGDLLAAGDAVETQTGASVALGITSGDVRLLSPGRIEVVSTSAAERRLRVALGAVEVDLPKKLPHGQSLILETPDAQVRVVGTAFRVEVNVDSAGKPVTEVNVRRGTVWVSQAGVRRAALGAGGVWRSAVETAPAAPEPKSEPVRTGVRGTLPRATRVAEVQGTLAEENRLYESALAARNASDDRRAAEGFGQLLARYPRSVLVEQSLAERFRALDRSGQVSLAVAAARRYLAAYPDGFARADAERIVKR